MEFYIAGMRRKNSKFKFQFPTGWNSTIFVEKGGEAKRRFNSQRDGILLKVKVSQRFNLKCFNSQRDGILPANAIDIKPPKAKFQFPTGWNSTQSRRVCYYYAAPVSIPNGMEFYYRSSLYLHEMTTVSIPNGMEFYSSVFGSVCSSRLFQFPTGWNSTLPIISVPMIASIVSIPNGMEFYSNSALNWKSNL